MVICSGSNIWDNRMSFCSVLSESTVIKFWRQHGNWSFSRKSKFELEECLLLQDEHIVVLCFYFSCWLLKCILFLSKMKKYFRLREGEQLGSFRINTTTWVLHSQCKNACVLSHIDHDMFCFFLMAGMTGAG
jgi:hypothetical protein